MIPQSSAGATPASRGRGVRATSSPFASHPHAFVCIYVVTAAFILGGPTLLYPFARDQSEFACIALSWLNGKVIYREVFDIKPPLTYLTHALAMTLFGRSMASIRILDFLFQTSTALVLVYIARIFYQSKGFLIGLLAATLYLCNFFWVGIWNTAQTDGFLILPLSLSVLAALQGDKTQHSRYWFFSGACLATSALYKYSIGTFAPFLIFFAAVSAYRGKKTGRTIAFLFIGFLLPVLILGIFLIRQRSFWPYIQAQSYLWSYVSGHGTAHRMNLIHFLFSDGMILVSLLIVLGEVATIINKFSSRSLLMIFWWVAAVLHTFVQNKFFLYHYLPLFAPQSIMAAHVIVYAWETLFSKQRLRVVVSFVLVALLSFQYFQFRWGDYQLLRKYLFEKRDMRTIYESQASSGMPVFFKVSDYVRSHTDSKDSIQIWGFEPAVYFLSSRACATSFFSDYSLMSRYEGAKQLQQTFIEEITRTRPEYFILVNDSSISFVTGNSENSQEGFDQFGDLRNFIKENYSVEITIANFVLWRKQR